MHVCHEGLHQNELMKVEWVRGHAKPNPKPTEHSRKHPLVSPQSSVLLDHAACDADREDALQLVVAIGRGPITQR